ncbi:MAG TPA: hypothetical protein VHV83_22270 [Armatimonadota bacterium]|nr:hypothetical protein [Armatimonadota bacterium]
MPREHWNDVPGDIAGGNDEDLPGGFGLDDPDNNTDATIDDVVDNDVINTYGQGFSAQDQTGGITSGTGYAHGEDGGSTVDPNELVMGEEAHPGAGVGFTGEERDKRVTPGSVHPEDTERDNFPLGGTPDESRTGQQSENISVETEGPFGGEGQAGGVHPDSGDKAA